MLAALLLSACERPAVDLDCNDPGVVCTIAGTGQLGFNGEGKAADDTWLFFPSALQWDAGGNLVIDDFNNMLVRVLETDGTLATVAGTNEHAYAIEGPATDSPLENPFDVAADPLGGIYVAELHAARILHIDAGGTLTIFAGSGKEGYSGDGGPATDAFLSEAYGVAAHEDGRVFVADTDNGAIRAIDPDGTIDTLASGLLAPVRVRVLDGALFVAERDGHAIRRVDLDSGAVELIAGNGTPGFSGDGGPAVEAQLTRPNGMTLGPDGSVYVADAGNDVVRRIDPDGTIETVLGVPGEPDFRGVPTAIEDARLDEPADLLFGPDGRLYVADMLNAAVRAVWLE